MTGRDNPVLVSLARESIYRKVIFAVAAFKNFRERHLYRFFLPGRNRYIPKRALRYPLAVVEQLPSEIIVGQVAGHKMVFYIDNARSRIGRREPYILIHLLDLHKSGVRRTVGLHQAVDTEVFIVSVVIRPEITSVAPIGIAVLIFGQKPLVYPVPYKATLHMRAGTYNIEIFLEISR